MTGHTALVTSATQPAVDAGSERAAELAKVEACLSRRDGAVVSVVGPRGSGKSFLTDVIVKRAEARGWRVTPYRDARGVRVGLGTTETELAADVRSALGMDAVTERRPLRALGRALVEEAGRAPILVVLDPFAPDDALLDRLRRDLIRTVRGSSRPVAILIVCRESLDGRIALDVELPIAAPSKDKVRSSLLAVAAASDLELGADELDCYVTAAGRSPRLLASLVAVLPMSRGLETAIVDPRGSSGTMATTETGSL